MKKRRITVNINSTIKYIQLWNGIFNLTSKEIEILSHFIEVNAFKQEENVCSVSNKKDVAAIIGLNDYNTLNMNINRIFNHLVISMYTIDIYDILIIQDSEGKLVTIRVEEYEDPADPLPLDS